MTDESERNRLLACVASEEQTIVAYTQRLVAAASPSPPGDTTAVARVATALLKTIPGARVRQYESAKGIFNVVATVQGGRPGKRLVFSGHLDTYPICEDLKWTVDPLGGYMEHGVLYGRGVCDMKGGIAASILATRILAEDPTRFSGEIVIALAGDEETMGVLGTQWLLENVDESKGDFVVCGDVGSPSVIRFGEKGLVWFEVTATGISGHGAHVHKGVNAIDRLRRALDAIKEVESISVSAPSEVLEAISNAHIVSEGLSGVGESDTLNRVTVNIGTISGGSLPNLIPVKAQAQGDIRLPVGVSVDDIDGHFNKHLDLIEGITWRITRAYEPTFTSPNHSLVQAALRAAKHVVGDDLPGPVANMRVGASDTRLFRRIGIPSVVVGCTPNNMGAADEYVVIQDLVRVAQIHTLIASDVLQ